MQLLKIGQISWKARDIRQELGLLGNRRIESVDKVHVSLAEDGQLVVIELKDLNQERPVRREALDDSISTNSDMSTESSTARVNGKFLLSLP